MRGLGSGLGRGGSGRASVAAGADGGLDGVGFVLDGGLAAARAVWAAGGLALGGGGGGVVGGRQERGRVAAVFDFADGGGLLGHVLLVCVVHTAEPWWRSDDGGRAGGALALVREGRVARHVHAHLDVDVRAAAPQRRDVLDHARQLRGEPAELPARLDDPDEAHAPRGRAVREDVQQAAAAERGGGRRWRRVLPLPVLDDLAQQRHRERRARAAGEQHGAVELPQRPHPPVRPVDRYGPPVLLRLATAVA